MRAAAHLVHLLSVPVLWPALASAYQGTQVTCHLLSIAVHLLRADHVLPAIVSLEASVVAQISWLVKLPVPDPVFR